MRKILPGDVELAVYKAGAGGVEFGGACAVFGGGEIKRILGWKCPPRHSTRDNMKTSSDKKERFAELSVR